MNTTDLVRAVDNRLERLFDAVIDPARREGAMALLLCGYAAAWWLYAVISNSSQDVHFDMGEISPGRTRSLSGRRNTHR